MRQISAADICRRYPPGLRCGHGGRERRRNRVSVFERGQGENTLTASGGLPEAEIFSGKCVPKTTARPQRAQAQCRERRAGRRSLIREGYQRELVRRQPLVMTSPAVRSEVFCSRFGGTHICGTKCTCSRFLPWPWKEREGGMDRVASSDSASR